MAVPLLDPNAPDFTRRYVNLADPRLGAQALERLKRSADARTDAREAVDVSRRIKDPALTLVTLDALIALDGTAELASEAQALVERIRNAIPDPALRNTFLESETVRRVLTR